MRRALEGKRCVVTGSSTGIGLVVAKAFLDEGAFVVLNSRSAERAEAARRAIDPVGNTTMAVGADVSTPAGVDVLFEAALAGDEPVDVLVNNAGGRLVAEVASLELADWYTMIDTNLTGPLLCARAVIPRMKAQGSGVIVNVTSVAGLIGAPGRAAYVASKHGLEGLTKVLALELAPYGIRAVAIAPGMIGTNMTQGAADGATRLERAAGRNPLGRIGASDELASAIVFLASDAASYVNGVSLLVDGGWLANAGAL